MSDINNPPTTIVRSPEQNRLSQKIFDELVTPRFPNKTNYELKDRYWALANAPATHLEFTIIPDEYTHKAMLWDMDTLYRLGSMEGMELIHDVLQLQFVDKEMLLKSIAYSDTPNLMDRMTGSLPAFKAAEQERKPESSGLQGMGDKLMSLIPGRR